MHHEKHWAGGSTSWNQDCQENNINNINNLRYADDTTLMAESEELEPPDESESEKVDLKFIIQKT